MTTEEQAKEYALSIPQSEERQKYCEEDFIAGAEWAIEKACEWWKEELITPTMTQEGRQWFKNKVNAFRKAMEGGEE